MLCGYPDGSRRYAFRAPALVALLALAALLIFALPGAAQANGHGAQGKPGKGNHPGKAKNHPGKGKVVGVMTRNLYLGADLTPAIGAPDLDSFVDATGEVLRQVDANDFPTRARGLAAEILSQKPDLVGLQEVALWRTGPPSLAPVVTGQPTATTVRYDYLQLLLDALNRGHERYRAVVVKPEFDFEAPANLNGVDGDGQQPIPNAEINGRLTMRDVILARRGAGLKIANPTSGSFANLLTVPVAGVPVTVTRGWTAIDAKVRGSGWFRFVNTHLEAFDDASQQPSIRALQAGELVADGGPANPAGGLPVVLVGDLNSDDDTVSSGDQQAYRVLLDAGLRERTTDDPLSCCLASPLLAVGAGGSIDDFDHQVDHIMTDEQRIALLSSSVTGLEPVNGLWDSDHAGVSSRLYFAK